MSEPLFGHTIVASITPFDDNLELDLNRAHFFDEEMIRNSLTEIKKTIQAATIHTKS